MNAPSIVRRFPKPELAVSRPESGRVSTFAEQLPNVVLEIWISGWPGALPCRPSKRLKRAERDTGSGGL